MAARHGTVPAVTSRAVKAGARVAKTVAAAVVDVAKAVAEVVVVEKAVAAVNARHRVSASVLTPRANQLPWTQALAQPVQARRRPGPNRDSKTAHLAMPSAANAMAEAAAVVVSVPNKASARLPLSAANPRLKDAASVGPSATVVQTKVLAPMPRTGMQPWRMQTRPMPSAR